LLFLKCKLAQHNWNKLLKMNCTSNKLLLEGFLLVADSNSHVRCGTECNRRLVKRALSTMTKVVWRHILELVVSALPPPPPEEPAPEVPPRRSLLDVVSAYIERVTGIALRPTLRTPVSPSEEYLTPASRATMAAVLLKLHSVSVQPTWSSGEEVELTHDETDFMLDLAARLDRTLVLQTITKVLYSDTGYGFQGDADTYYDEQNSFIDCVIERRKGIPISLCALTKLVAAQCGLRGLYFSGMPGHVVLSLVSDLSPPLYLPLLCLLCYPW
jgi:hypothetical protein